MAVRPVANKRGRLPSLLGVSLVAVVALCAPRAYADPPHTTAKKAEPAALPVGTISPAMWQRASTAALQPGEIDRLVSAELRRTKIKPVARTTDEQFLRRVWLDLTGALPMPADLDDFLKDRDPNKRAKVIDQLLDSKAYAAHWARYWRDVIGARVTDPLARVTARHFETWMQAQLKANRSWAAVVRDILTASGAVRFNDPDSNGAAFFLLSRRGADAVTERAAETSRVFLGIQIQCAQCHDHPSDRWKRRQFHELAAYFARARERFVFEEKRIVGVRLVSVPFGEYQMPGREDPKKKTSLQPRFLDGKAAGERLSDPKRRQSLADAITAKENPWFAAAYVNRLWGELLGQSFCQPVDDLGPEKEVVFPTVLTRLAGAFRGSDYDVKALFRAILNSAAYQRQIRPGESADEHLLFASIYPRRLPADALWKSLTGALGRMGPPVGMGPRRPMGPFARFFGLEAQFQQEFAYDPSSRPEEVEGSVSQALLMMNNPVINQKIRATGTNLLARILKSYSDDGEALRMLYLRALARRPTARELVRCRQHIGTVGSRAEAFEDILWALLNSTEFQTRR